MPLAAKPKKDFGATIWAGCAVSCALAWAAFIEVGFGDLRSAFALSSLTQKAIHVAFAATLCFCALRAYVLGWYVSRLPYGNGYYLFPSGVVHATGSKLIEYEVTDIESASANGAQVVVRLRPSGSFSFPAMSPEAAAKIVTAFQTGRERWQELATAEPLERARLCPLMESGVPNPLAPTDAYLRPVLLPLPVFSALVVILALALGLGIVSARDSLSRKALYRAATSENSVEAYRAYLERGGTREEVTTLLLPRAELGEAVSLGTVAAIEEFKAKNSGLEIDGEVQNALRVALLKELDEAIKKDSLTALDEVPKRFKSHALIAGEIATARQALFNKAFANFEAQASDKLKDLIPFVQGLLAHSQAHGPEVQLRFMQVFPQAPEKLDQIVAKSKKYYMGRKSLPTQYFLGEQARRREKGVLETVQKRLQAAFPKDILEFKIGPPATAENVTPPELQIPVRTFSHRERLSGGFVGGKPKAMYMGAAILMGAEGTLPGAAEPMAEFKWNAWRSPNFKVLSDNSKDMPDVYEDMMGGTFDEFAELYMGRWFKEP